MKIFFADYIQLYGNSFLVYNVHAHLHFPGATNIQGSLDNASAYQFENKLEELNTMVRSSHRAIVGPGVPMEYLEDFTYEVKHLMHNGMDFCGKKCSP